MAQPVARYLVDVAQGPGAGGAVFGIGKTASKAAPDEAAIAREAYERGLAEARAAAQDELAMAISDERRAAAKQLEDQRRLWKDREGERLAAAITTGLATIETRIAETVATIIEPFVTERVRIAACSDVVATVKDISNRSRGVAIELKGPDDLVRSVAERLPKDIVVTTLASEGPEVRAIVDQTIIETRIGAWLQRLSEALE